MPVVLGQAYLVPQGGSPMPFPSIQAAVDAGSEGDTVRLSDGLFRGPGNRNVVVTGKNLRIESQNGPANCVIDCERKGRGFFFTGPEVTQQTILRGVTILRGKAGIGGGIRVDIDSLATIEDCVIGDGNASFGGGIEYCRVTPPRGIIRDCLVFGNTVSSQGGGIRGFCVTIERCTIVDNVSKNEGAGLFLASNAVLRDSVIARNRLVSPFSANGGGMHLGGPVRVESCTIVDNTATGSGGGICAGFCPYVVVSNCILWGNRAKNPTWGDQVFQNLIFGSSNVVLRHSDVEGGRAGVATNPNGPPGMAVLHAILDVDPAFVDRAGGDYHLTADSPLIGAGDPELSPSSVEADHDGEPRANGPLDIGADERYDGLALSLPLPGRTGEPNTLRIRGAQPGATVLFFAGLQAQPAPAAPSETPCGPPSGIASATLLASSTADPSGEASLRLTIPPSLSLQTVLFQAQSFDPSSPQTTCTTSNRISIPFP